MINLTKEMLLQCIDSAESTNICDLSQYREWVENAPKDTNFYNLEYGENYFEDNDYPYNEEFELELVEKWDYDTISAEEMVVSTLSGDGMWFDDSDWFDQIKTHYYKDLRNRKEYTKKQIKLQEMLKNPLDYKNAKKALDFINKVIEDFKELECGYPFEKLEIDNDKLEAYMEILQCVVNSTKKR